jgi:hypothetical protein
MNLSHFLVLQETPANLTNIGETINSIRTIPDANKPIVAEASQTKHSKDITRSLKQETFSSCTDSQTVETVRRCPLFSL